MNSDELSAKSLLGQTIQQHKLETLIASGGMGNLYRVLALQAPIQPTYRAMKLLTPQGKMEASIVERFQRESRILEQLKHPNIVHLREYGIDPEHGPFMIMEYLEGSTLKEQSKDRKDPFPTNKILSWLQQICQALHFCHHKSMVHRDIKPANIFVHAAEGQEELIKLLDFGITFSPTEPDQTGERVGTPRYMAPEQVLRQPVTRQTDIYSLGIVIFELLTRRVVFEGMDSDVLRQAQLQQTPPRLGKVRPDFEYSEELENFIQVILAKDPTQRPTSAPALFQQLSSLLAASPIKKKDGPLGIVIQGEGANPFFDANAPTPPPDMDTPQDPLTAIPAKPDDRFFEPEHPQTAPQTALRTAPQPSLQVNPLDAWEEHQLPGNEATSENSSFSSGTSLLIALLLLGGILVLGGLVWFLWTLV